jgi:hypothetical protein
MTGVAGGGERGGGEWCGGGEIEKAYGGSSGRSWLLSSSMAMAGNQ